MHADELKGALERMAPTWIWSCQWDEKSLLTCVFARNRLTGEATVPVLLTPALARKFSDAELASLICRILRKSEPRLMQSRAIQSRLTPAEQWWPEVKLRKKQHGLGKRWEM